MDDEKGSAPETAKESAQKMKKDAANVLVKGFRGVGIPESWHDFYLSVIKWGAIASVVSVLIDRAAYFIAIRVLLKSAISTASSLLGSYGSLLGGVMSSATSAAEKAMKIDPASFLIQTFWQAIYSGAIGAILILIIMRFVFPFWPKSLGPTLFYKLLIVGFVLNVLSGGVLGVAQGPFSLAVKVPMSFYLIMLVGNAIAAFVSAKILATALEKRHPSKTKHVVV